MAHHFWFAQIQEKLRTISVVRNWWAGARGELAPPTSLRNTHFRLPRCQSCASRERERHTDITPAQPLAAAFVRASPAIVPILRWSGLSLRSTFCTWRAFGRDVLLEPS